MTDTQNRTAREGSPVRRRRTIDRLLDAYRSVVAVYTGFLLGILSYAGWRGDDDLVFWPWSLVFLLLIAGLIICQRRWSAATG